MSISFPFILILIPYGLVLAFFTLLAIVNVAHIVGYGETTGPSFIVTFLFLAGAAFILFFTWHGVAGTDWMAPVTLGTSALMPASFPQP